MDVASVINDNYAEICAVAEDFGIDFSKARHRVDCSGDMVYVEPLSKKDKQKTMMVSRVNGKTLVITFYTYKGGRHGTWKYTDRSGSRITVSRIIRKRARLRREHEQAALRSKEQLNRQYIARFQETEETTFTFPYLLKKGLDGKILVKKMTDQRGEFLAVPVHGPEGIRGLQRIYGEKDKNGRQKLFTPGTVKKGSFVLVGEEPDEETPVVFLCEGWADAATIHLATGAPAYCAFDCGNLRNVAAMLLKKLSPSQIVLAADDDRWDRIAGNAGIIAGLELSYYHQIKVRKPVFDGFLPGEDARPKDFNDLLLLAGPEEVSRQLLTVNRESIVRAPGRAFEFNCEVLRHTGVRGRHKQLLNTVRAGIRRELSPKKTELVLEKAGVPAEEVQKAWDKCMRASYARVRSLHKISQKANPGVTFVELELDRQDHGGYLISESFIDKIRNLKGIIILKSPMGSGKTERIIKQLMIEEKSGAYVAHRVSLVEEACTRLQVMSYRGAEEADIRGTGKVGVCANSLNHPRFDRGQWFSEAGLVCVDEGSKVFDHLCGPTIHDPEGVMETFLGMLEVAQKVVICDADASDNLIRLIQKMIPDREITVAMPVSAPMDHVRVSLTGSEDAGYKKIFSSVKMNKNVLVATDSKKEVKKIARKLKKKNVKVLAVHSESRVLPEVETWIKNPNRESTKYQVVVYNSCVDSGVSLTTEHFDETVGMFKGVVTPDTVKQMMGRNRCARDWFLVVNPLVKSRFGCTEQEMYQALAAAHCKVLWDKKEQKAVPVPDLSDYDQVRTAMVRRKVQMCQDYTLSVKIMLEQDGYEVKYMTTEEGHMTDLEKEMKEIGDEIEEEWTQLILNTPAPPPAEYRKLKEAYVISEEEHARVVRYEIENTLCKKEIESSDVSFWFKNGRRKILLLETLLTDAEKLHAYDSFELKRLKSLTLRRNLLTKGDLLKNMIRFLGIDLVTGEGLFTHREARQFIVWIYENKNRLLNWNLHGLGPFLGSRPPADPVKFVKEVLAALGIKTCRKNKTKKRLSHHFFRKDSWDQMLRYLEDRKEAGKNVSDIPRNIEELAEKMEENKSALKTEAPEQDAEEAFKEWHESLTHCSCGNPLSDHFIEWQMEQCEICQAQLNGDDSD